MSSLFDLLDTLRNTGDYARLRTDVTAQFGTEGQPYLGAALLPEQIREANFYTEQQVRMQTVLANAGGSYSPAQLNTGGRIYGEFKVVFGNTNVADQLTAYDYDRLMQLVVLSTVGGNDNATLQAMAQVMGFLDRNIREPILALNELYRWQAIIDGVVKRRGSNGYSEDVVYTVPAGHRVTIPGGTVAAKAGWFEPTGSYSPMADFFNAKNVLAKKGYTINRIYSDFSAAYAFQTNASIVNQLGGATIINAGGAFSRTFASVDMDKVNASFVANKLAPWTIYDRTFNYRNPNSANGNGIDVGRYLERNIGGVKTHPVILICTTGRAQEVIDYGDRSSLPNGGLILDDTLGYYGIGKVAGQSVAGRHMYEEVELKHPGGMSAECIQEGLPVITEPEAIFVMYVQEPV